MRTAASKKVRTSAGRAKRSLLQVRTPGSADTYDQNLGLAERARLELEELILTLDLPPGSTWSEAELSERVGIGRTPVREALQRMQGDHLVAIVPRLGVQVTDIDARQQLLLLEVRREVERLVCVCAARRGTADEKKKCLEMAQTLQTMVDAEVVQFLRYHYHIKRFIVEMARNPYVTGPISAMHAISRRFYYLHHQHAHDLPVAARHHIEIIEAVAAGDEAAAAAASDRLMDYAEGLTRDTILRKF